MAGGVGSRFWPVSTWAFPKQFHDMLGTGQTLLQRTYQRLASFIPKENILISTNEIYKNLVKTQLAGITEENLVLEPSMRNTAPCILYATMKIQKRNPNAVFMFIDYRGYLSWTPYGGFFDDSNYKEVTAQDILDYEIPQKRLER